MPINEKVIQHATTSAHLMIQEALNRAERLREDTYKDRRTALQECRSCHYVRGARIAGQAFRAFFCEVCREEHMHPNTNVPKLCKGCAEKQNICCRCLGEMTV